MKYLQEYRDPKIAQEIIRKIHAITTRPHAIMEVCGGQTHSIVKYGIDSLLPEPIKLIHGPGCPVCVTPLEKINKAINLALRENIILCSFGDMLRVPGSNEDLFSSKSKGGDVRIVYSPMDCLKIAKNNPGKEVVFFAVGFETTAPGNAWAVYFAKKQKIGNFSLLSSHVLVPPAIEAILSSDENKVQGFLAAGHVCAVMGFKQYIPIAEKYQVPIVVTGFEPVDILQGIHSCVNQLENHEARVENEYRRAVKPNGNLKAIGIIQEVFRVVDRQWRGIGVIPQSGLSLNKSYASFDAEKKFDLMDMEAREPEECKSGLVLQGRLKPSDCAQFGKKCTPEHPLGATMVSSEGACAAYYKYRK